MRIDVRADFTQVLTRLDALQADVRGPTLARAMNRTMEQARTQMSREIRREYNLGAAYVRDRLRIKRAFAGVGQFRLQAELIGGDPKRRSANVIVFGARPGRTGVSVMIRRGQRREIPGTFIGNKGRTVFRRVGPKRLPIEPVQTIDVGQMFNARRINEVVLRTLRERFPVVLAREVAFSLQRFSR